MTDPGPDDGVDHQEVPPGPRFDSWDLAAAIILSLATVASAWSSYQAARWSSAYSKESRASTRSLFEATKQHDVAGRQQSIDVSTFTLWFEATVKGDDALAAEVSDRFRPELLTAFEDWWPPGQDRSDLPAGTPMDMDSYRLAAADEVDRLVSAAEDHATTADEASQTGDRFVLTAVLYASVLFFAGIASKLSDPRSEHLAVGLSATMFVVASVVVLTLPHRFGF
ncbi:MAG: hypothetical protein IPG97_07415 [Microthrixaceae bacterium]|nr:hypothetical protein [Microthrixaceae bacterium]